MRIKLNLMATTDLSFYQEGLVLSPAERDGGLWVHIVGESGTRQSAAYELPPLRYGFNGRKQFIVSIRLNDKAVSITERYPRHVHINLMTQEEYFGIGSNFTNPSSGFNPI